MEKVVLPKFWQFLSNAAYGNAHVVMISVLPFISTLPDEVILNLFNAKLGFKYCHK
jgi:hypothetical protein